MRGGGCAGKLTCRLLPTIGRRRRRLGWADEGLVVALQHLHGSSGKRLGEHVHENGILNAALRRRVLWSRISTLSASSVDGLNSKDQGKPRSGRQPNKRRPVKSSKPAEIGVEITGRHAMESANPVLETAILGIHLLALKSAPRTRWRAEACTGRWTAPTSLTAAARSALLSAAKMMLARCARTILDDEYRNLLVGQSALGGSATTLTRGSTQMAPTLARVQKDGHIRLGNMRKCSSLKSRWGRQRNAAVR